MRAVILQRGPGGWVAIPPWVGSRVATEASGEGVPRGLPFRVPAKSLCLSPVDPRWT